MQEKAAVFMRPIIFLYMHSSPPPQNIGKGDDKFLFEDDTLAMAQGSPHTLHKSYTRDVMDVKKTLQLCRPGRITTIVLEI